MAKRKLNSKEKRKQARAQKRQGLVQVTPFTYQNGLGTTFHLIECERCGRKHDGGEQSWVKDRPCICGHEYARYA